MDAAVMLNLRRQCRPPLRHQLHALTYNLGNFMRTLAMPKAVEPWSLTSLREKLIKIGAKVVSHGRFMDRSFGCSRSGHARPKIHVLIYPSNKKVVKLIAFPGYLRDVGVRISGPRDGPQPHVRIGSRSTRQSH